MLTMYVCLSRHRHWRVFVCWYLREWPLSEYSRSLQVSVWSGLWAGQKWWKLHRYDIISLVSRVSCVSPLLISPSSLSASRQMWTSVPTPPPASAVCVSTRPAATSATVLQTLSSTPQESAVWVRHARHLQTTHVNAEAVRVHACDVFQTPALETVTWRFVTVVISRTVWTVLMRSVWGCPKPPAVVLRVRPGVHPVRPAHPSTPVSNTHTHTTVHTMTTVHHHCNTISCGFLQRSTEFCVLEEKDSDPIRSQSY